MSADTNHPFSGQIILFKGQSQYDVLRCFIDDLYEGFRELGHNAAIVDLTSPDAGRQLGALLAQPVFFVLGMNGVGIEIQSGNRSLYDVGGFPYFAFLVDHPLYHRARLKTNVQNLIVSCIDKTHVEFLSKYENMVCSKVFIPHGARLYAEPRPFSRRTYRLSFAGSYVDPDQVRNQWQGFDSHLARFLDDAAERALYDSERTLPDIFRELLSEKGLDENPVYVRKLTEVMLPVDRFVRARRRLMVLEALKDFPLHVFGNGWDNCPLYDHNQWVFHPPVSYKEMQEIMGDSQMVLSVLPYFQFGGHERIFSAMLAGAVLLTDTNAYLNQHLRPDKDFVPYSLAEPDRLRQQVGALFDDPVLLEEMAESGRDAVMRGHLWKHRAEQIVEAVKFHYTFYPLHM